MSTLFRKVLKSYIFGGVIGLVCGYFIFLIVGKFSNNIHLQVFPIAWITAVIGALVGYGAGLYRQRCIFAAAPDIEGLKVLGIGVFCGFLLLSAFFATSLTKAHSAFVNDVRQISNEPVVEIVFSTAWPDYKPLARIRDPNFVKSFTDKLASAEIYSPSHDSHASEGHVTLVLKYSIKLEWEWYTPERDPSYGILDGRARVPGLGPLLTNGPKQAR